MIILPNYRGVDSAAMIKPYLRPLDTLSGSVVAVSVRRLNSSYTGACMRVRRSNDNTEQDIGFNGNALDTAALTSFVGSASGFVTKWYDQSGNGRDFSQSTNASQPRIVNAGAIETENGVPVVYSIGHIMSTASVSNTVIDNGTATLGTFTVLRGNSLNYWLSFESSFTNTPRFSFLFSNRWDYPNGFSGQGRLTGYSISSTVLNQCSFYTTGGSKIARISRVQGASQTTYSALTTDNAPICLFGDTWGGNSTCRMGELIHFNRSVTSGELSIIEWSQKQYFSTP